MKKCLGLFVTTVVCAALSFSAFAEGDTVDTIFSNDDLSIDLISTDVSSSYSWTLRLENKTKKEITVSSEYIAVNDLVANSSLYEIIPAGKTVESVLEWPLDTFKECGITDFTKLALNLQSYYRDDYETIMDSQEYVYYPNGEDAYKTYERTPSDSDIVVLDNDSVSVIIESFGVPENEWVLYSVKLYVENKTDHELYFALNNAKVNGIDCDPYWGSVVAPSLKQYSEINYMSYVFDGLDISAIENITGDIVVTDWTDYDDIGSGSINLSVDGTATVSVAPSETEGSLPAASEPVDPIAVNPDEAVRSSGAEGKTWADFFGK